MHFTIVIPAYNSADFIHLPLNSLEKQTYQGTYEVLIIDDGSKDALAQKIAPYLKRNTHWKLITKANGNWGSVINFVKENRLIQGKYVTILDSDDYFKPQMLAEVAQQKADVIMTGIYKFEKNKEKIIPVFLNSRSKFIKPQRAFTPLSTPHGKFYKKSLFMQGVNLPEKVAYQDTVLFNDLISKAQTIFYLKAPLVVWWRDRVGNSTTEIWDEKRVHLWLKTCQKITHLPRVNQEAKAWVLMYLWELKRNYKGKIPFRIHINTKKIKFLWLPFGLRHLAKLYFCWQTRKFRK